MKFFGYWTLFTALAVSTVAAYYSIVGLTAIFAAAIIPIIIMGSALEVAKVTTAIWLHRYWDFAPSSMKFYLTSSTVVLMFITSMGIFGFLSKAHIEQTAMATEGVAQVERIDTELARYDQDILRAEQGIDKIENTTSSTDDSIQEKIATEEQRIANVYARLEIDIAAVQSRLDDTIAPYEQIRATVDAELSEIAELLGNNEIRRVQALIGVNPDGAYGANTAAAVASFRQTQSERRDNALLEIRQARDDAESQIAILRQTTDDSVNQSNQLINRLRSQLGVVTAADQSESERLIALRSQIENAESAKDELVQEKFKIEIENRKLEAEVGPVKYIAEMIYGENTGTDTLEKAVRYVILMLVAVFDPLAIVLVLAGVMTIERANKESIGKIKESIGKTDNSADSKVDSDRYDASDEEITETDYPSVRELLHSGDIKEGKDSDTGHVVDGSSNDTTDDMVPDKEVPTDEGMVEKTTKESVMTDNEDNVVKNKPDPDIDKSEESNKLSPDRLLTGRLFRRNNN